MAKKTVTIECHDCENITTIVLDPYADIDENDICYCPICGSKDNISLES